VITYPHIEESNLTHYISRKSKIVGLSSTKEVKKEFCYKERLVTIKGYEEFGVSNTFNILVIGLFKLHLSGLPKRYTIIRF
jgi:hypothetical protein